MVTRESVKGLNPYFPVLMGKVTAGFWEPRPLSGPKLGQYHRAWDIGAPWGTPILAEEDGQLTFHVIYRSPTPNGASPGFSANLTMPDGKWYWLSNLYRDNYGCLVILRAKSGLIYVHCHTDELQFFEYMRALIEAQHGRPAFDAIRPKETRVAYNSYTAAIVTDGIPVMVTKGTRIGAIGSAGYSTGPHVHLQIHAAEDYNSRIDPAELWPMMPVQNASPAMGPQPGALFIPS